MFIKTVTMMKLRNIKIVNKGFYLYIKTGFFNINIRNRWKCLSLCFHFYVFYFFRVCVSIQYFIDMVRNKLQTIKISVLKLIKRRSKIQEKNMMSCKRALNFDQWKTFSKKPMRVWLWLVYKFTENYCCLWLFSEFI